MKKNEMKIGCNGHVIANTPIGSLGLTASAPEGDISLFNANAKDIIPGMFFSKQKQ